MKRLLHLCLLATGLLTAPFSIAGTVLWTKNITNIGNNSYWRVGSDGAVAIVQQKPTTSSVRDLEKIHWYARDGSEIAVPPSSFTYVYGPVYVSKDELAVFSRFQPGVNNDYRLEVFQVVASNAVENTIVSADNGPYTSFNLNFPYLLNSEVLEDNGNGSKDYRFSLIDLTNANTLEIVGEAVIGIHGNNLKIRWKTIANAKYKVQISTNLLTWSDYTEIIDGNGSMMIVNVPVDDPDAGVFARVVKL
jgi:hypothetical protein